MTGPRRKNLSRVESEISSRTLFRTVAAIILVLVIGAFGALYLGVGMSRPHATHVASTSPR